MSLTNEYEENSEVYQTISNIPPALKEPLQISRRKSIKLRSKAKVNEAKLIQIITTN